MTYMKKDDSMPGFFTHYLCGQKLFDSLGNKNLKNLISQHREVYNLGTQGPDVFFFYLGLPWKKGITLNKCGSLLHNERIGEFFSRAISYAAGLSGNERDTISTYLYGFACHYALDTTTHPYIYYKTGFVRKGEKQTTRYSILHTRFETALDVLMLRQERSIHPRQLSGSRLITLDSQAAIAIGRLYSTIFQDVFSLEIPEEQVVKAITDMKLVYRLVRDRYGLKKGSIRFITLLTGYENVAFELIHPHKVEESIDYLNLSRIPWTLPWDNSIRKIDSFPELFYKAISQALELCQALYSFLDNQSTSEECLDRFGSRCFSTGIDCHLKPEFKFYSCVFEET